MKQIPLKLPVDLANGLEELVRRRRSNRNRTLTNIVRDALREEGLWPWPPQSETKQYDHFTN